MIGGKLSLYALPNRDFYATPYGTVYSTTEDGNVDALRARRDRGRGALPASPVSLAHVDGDFPGILGMVSRSEIRMAKLPLDRLVALADAKRERKPGEPKA